MMKYLMLEQLYSEYRKSPDDCNPEHSFGGPEHVKAVEDKKDYNIGEDGDTHYLGDIPGILHLFEIIKDAYWFINLLI